MTGNVLEWCGDWYAAEYTAVVDDPQGASSGSYRVFRGGSWNDYAVYCRSANRHYYSPGYRYFSLGFRLAAVPE